MKNPEKEKLRDMNRWRLSETDDGGHSLSKVFQFYVGFQKVKRNVFDSGLREYTFFNKIGHSVLVLYSSFLPKYVLKELDKIVEVSK